MVIFLSRNKCLKIGYYKMLSIKTRVLSGGNGG